MAEKRTSRKTSGAKPEVKAKPAEKPKGEAAGKKKRGYRRMTTGVIGIAIQVAVTCLIVVVFYIGMSRAYRLGYHIFSNEAVDSAPGITMNITIVEGQSAYTVGQTLQKKGLIEDGIAFWIQSMVYDADIYPGTYTVSTAMSSKEILLLMDCGPETEEAP